MQIGEESLDFLMEKYPGIYCDLLFLELRQELRMLEKVTRLNNWQTKRIKELQKWYGVVKSQYEL